MLTKNIVVFVHRSDSIIPSLGCRSGPATPPLQPQSFSRERRCVGCPSAHGTLPSYTTPWPGQRSRIRAQPPGWVPRAPTAVAGRLEQRTPHEIDLTAGLRAPSHAELTVAGEGEKMAPDSLLAGLRLGVQLGPVRVLFGRRGVDGKRYHAASSPEQRRFLLIECPL